MTRERPFPTGQLLPAAVDLRQEAAAVAFAPPVAWVYNPLEYAWESHSVYLSQWGTAPKRVVFLGMNPGPWGMTQTGVPFGEIEAVRDWLGISTAVATPARTHPRLAVTGFACHRSEVSGRRLWGLFRDRFTTPAAFFAEHFVANYCPLLLLDAAGSNLTPDKLPANAASTKELLAACDRHLQQMVAILKPQWVIGVGRFAAAAAERALAGSGVETGQVLHPSPASPAANRGWAEAATAQLQRLPIW